MHSAWHKNGSSARTSWAHSKMVYKGISHIVEQLRELGLEIREHLVSE